MLKFSKAISEMETVLNWEIAAFPETPKTRLEEVSIVELKVKSLNEKLFVFDNADAAVRAGDCATGRAVSTTSAN